MRSANTKNTFVSELWGKHHINLFNTLSWNLWLNSQPRTRRLKDLRTCSLGTQLPLELGEAGLGSRSRWATDLLAASENKWQDADIWDLYCVALGWTPGLQMSEGLEQSLFEEE